MADAKRVFTFEIDGIEKSIEDFNTLSEAIDTLDRSFEAVDSTIDAANQSLEGFGEDVDLKDSAKKFENFADDVEDALKGVGEGLDTVKDGVEGVDEALDEVTAEDKVSSLGEIGQGLADGFSGLAEGLKAFGVESENIDKVKERIDQLNAALQGVVSLTSALSKENRAAAASLISGFKASTIGVRLFGTAARTAIASTGIGLLVIAIGLLVTNWDKAKQAAIDFGERAKKAIDTFTPALGALIDRTQQFSERVGGFRQLFAGALESAKVFFTSIGESFAALLKGDIGRIREIFRDFGQESVEAFNEGVKVTNEKIAEERLRAQVATEIKIQERLIEERKAAGRDTFNLERANLRRRISLAEAGSEELLDLQSELRQLQLSRQKEFNDAQIAEDKRLIEEQKALREEEAAEEIEFFEELLDREAEIEERNAEAAFERSQLIKEAELAALEAQQEESIKIIEDAAEIRLQIAEAERDRALENEELTNEERLLILEEFNVAELEIQAEKVEALLSLEEEQTAKKQEEADKQAEIDKQAKEDEIKREEALVAALDTLNNQRLSNAQATIQLISDLAKEGSALQKATFALDKALAAAEVLINLQVELSAIAASNAGLGPAAPAVIAALQTQAGIRAALGLATIASTVIKFKKGGLLKGPSHRNRGIRGTGRFNNVEVEGGEFIVNKQATKKYLPQLRAMNSYKFQDGGILPDFDTINSSITPVDNFNSLLIQEIRAINSAPVVVSVEEINTVQDRVADIRDNATI